MLIFQLNLSCICHKTSTFLDFPGKEYEKKYKLALQLLSSQHLSLQNHETEFSIVQNIKKMLGTKERYQDARKFDDLYARLTASVS